MATRPFPSSARRPRVLAAVVAAVVAPLAGCGGDDGSPRPVTVPTVSAPDGSGSPTTSSGYAPADEIVAVRFLDGRVVDGVRRATVDVGAAVVVRVEADVADEVHVHGYDLTAEVAPMRPAELRFEADIPGVFEVELERRGVTIVELTVR